ncbi:MAG: hypothetical protein AAB738_01450 [Patescibacteria group bacterium]
MNTILKSIIKGLAGTIALLILYFGVVSAISGWSFAKDQFSQNWYWFTALSIGFGIQIGLFTYLRALHRAQVAGRGVVISGTTSGVAMLACCAHYLVNIIPIIGIAGVATIIGQYQTEIFILGLAANLAGIGYLFKKLKEASAA